ncbi:RNA polymerase sigma factor [Microbacterium sp. NPDC058389]|uniref:RNA polymerase sigma factor n=1 Tax=Microbacterium sp. NPDC058389 TaxID=3346475 RepID=UPI00365203D7
MSEADAAARGGPDAAGGPVASGSAGVAASDRLLASVVREESARITAALTVSFGSFDVAEEAVAEAVEEALTQWRGRGIPPKPGAWLMQAARHNALDRVRRARVLRDKVALLPDPTPQDGSAAADERLPLLFGCCHPALAPEAQLALTLRAVCGLTTAQIARATFSTEPATGQRISRAKRKIADSGIPLRVPSGPDAAARLDLVLTIVSVMYSEAHFVAGGDAAADRDLADDALWLAEVIARALPRAAEAHGLLALLRFHRARESARSVDGELVLLADQDRSRWDPALLSGARDELERAARLRRPGRWQLHAAIAACHADAPDAATTDWLQVLTLYDMLLAYDRTPVVRLNRAVALARVDGADVALTEVDALADPLSRSHLWHAVRASLLRDLGRDDEALAADLRALELTANEAERRLLATRAGR